MTVSRPRPWLLMALTAALLALPALRHGEADPKMPPPANAKEAKKYKGLVEAARAYLDLDEDSWSGRKQLEDELNRLATEGLYPLTDMAFLNWLVGQSRSFLPPLNDRKWAKANGISVEDRGSWGYELKGEGTGDQGQRWAHIREPNQYVKKPSDLEDIPRKGPWPVVLAMHTKRDPDHKDGAGRAWLQGTAKWDRKIHADLFDRWFVLMPIVAAAKYAEDGVIRPEKIYAILRDFWNRYHMDFERVVLDGADDALLFASTNGTNFLSGVVLRDAALKDGKLASSKLVKSVANIAHIPVYVVDKPAVAKALKAAGLAHVVEGDGDASLVKWMGERARTMPKKFSWNIAEKDQQVAYWVNVDQPLWDSTVRTIDVDVPEDEPNTIDVTAIGVGELSLFLDDTLVDLDEPIKVRINGTLVHDKKLEPRKKYIGIKRDLKDIFEMPPVDVRKYRYYGWLKPGSIVRIGVPEPKPDKESGADPKVTPEERADEKQEADAAKLYGKAEALAETNPAKALKLLAKVLALPFNKQTEKARALKAKIEAAAKPKDDAGK